VGGGGLGVGCWGLGVEGLGSRVGGVGTGFGVWGLRGLVFGAWGVELGVCDFRRNRRSASGSISLYELYNRFRVLWVVALRVVANSREEYLICSEVSPPWEPFSFGINTRFSAVSPR